MSVVRERDVENYLISKVKAHGGEVRKLRWLGRNGAPDRLVLIKDSYHFAEIKRPGEWLSAAQDREHQRLWDKGKLFVWVLDSYEMVDFFMEPYEDAA